MKPVTGFRDDTWMTYRGQGGWSWSLAQGPLVEIVERFVGKIGTDAFFDLI